ncbi:AraC family transcriptional regulator [Streptomyces brasiliensis]|uniref:AraC family transcriptional regulator n=2 Tax=Streptomyces brasiliensis TaxID=1954 RepID=A0A917PF86_9ACTN|nr:AraC family transcriptional regulator [Streptomyces brasiliensis]
MIAFMDTLSAALGSVRVGRAQACWVKQSGAWGMRHPSMTMSGFHVLVRGTAWLITSTGPPRALRPGDVVLAPSGAEHGLSHAPGVLRKLRPAVLRASAPGDEPSDVAFLCGAYWLDHGTIHHYLRALPDVIVISPDYDRDVQVRSLVDMLGADVSDARPGSSVTRPALLDLLLTHVLRQWLEQDHEADRPDTNDPVIAAALREIHTSPHQAWTVQRLSEAVGISRTALTKRFTSVVGKPPMTYLTSWRLTCAARLLRETDAPLAAVARQVGYSTAFAFGAAFRREYGIPPGRFRDLDPAYASGRFQDPASAHDSASASPPSPD